MTLRVLDLFSGIGGFSLGLERTGGFRPVAFCEIDPYCRAVLAKHWPGVPIHEDVRSLSGADVGPVDVICGGFPCQDISTAGKGAGLRGERSGLWSEYRRLIEEIRPAWVVIENVSALRSRGLDQVLGEISALGYDAEWHCIPAAAVGAPHRRDRVWIVAHSQHQGRDAGRVLEHGEIGRPLASWEASSVGGSGQDVAHTYEPRLEGWLRESLSERAGECASGEGGTSVGNAECPPQDLYSAQADQTERREIPTRQSGWWLIEPNVGRVANGVPFELDIIGRLNEIYSSETISEVDAAVRRVLLYVWEHQDLAAASPQLYRRGLRNCVPEVSHPNPCGGWLLGPGLKEDQGLRDLWEAVCSKPQQEAQNLQRELLERVGQKKRPKAMGTRVDRLRALGNAVVPQIPEIIGRAILEAEAVMRADSQAAKETT